MMFTLRHFFRKAVAVPDSKSGTTSYEDLPPSGTSEKTNHVWNYVSSPPSKTRSEHKKLHLAVKFLLLALPFVVILFFGPSIKNYIMMKYNAMLQSSKAHEQATCSQDISPKDPISIVASPITDQPVSAEKILGRKAWTPECSSNKNSCGLAIDDAGDNTYWQSDKISPSGGHWIVIKLQGTENVHSLAMRPSQKWNTDGGAVQKHRVEVSTNNVDWQVVAFGAWRDNGEEKFATFEPRAAQYVRLTVIDSTRNMPFVAISDINIYRIKNVPPSVNRGGKWNMTLNFPLVPVTAWLNPLTQALVTMSASDPDSFPQGKKWTLLATWDPKKGIIEQTKLESTQHSIFCPGTSYDADGKVMVTGGVTDQAVSVYDPMNDTSPWSIPGKDGKIFTLNIGRGYQGQAFLPNGRTFVVGGEWSGTAGTKRDAELFDPASGWNVLKNVRATAIQMDPVVASACPSGEPKNDKPCKMTEWQQHHSWLFAWKKDSIFHAGPSKNMHWITTSGDGKVDPAGARKDDNFADGDAVCGVTSMYDAERGIILTAGGAPNYHYWLQDKDGQRLEEHRKEATTNAFEITLGDPYAILKPKKIASMKYPRIFANGVILPTGETLVVGGQRLGEPFDDNTWQSVPEIYSPEKKEWREVTRHSTPRTYHSWAMLLPDTTVIVGGGGLSADHPETNHYDAQIYQPAYLFMGIAQPKINTINKIVYKISEEITITTDVEVEGASLIRYSAATHALNNDLRRIKLTPATVGNAANKKYSMKIPNDVGVVLPGYYMLFVLHKGVPSNATTVQILAK